MSYDSWLNEVYVSSFCNAYICITLVIPERRPNSVLVFNSHQFKHDFIFNFVPMWGFAGGVHISAGVCRIQKRISPTLELELKVAVSYPTWLLNTNSDPLKEQYVLLINESSL